MARFNSIFFSWRFWIVPAAIMALATFVPFSAATAQSIVLVDRAGGAYQQLKVVLSAERAATPGQVVALTFAATPLLTAPDLTISWELPDGGLLLGGPTQETRGAVTAQESVQQVRQVQFPAEGVYTVRTQATYHPDPATTLTAVGVLFFTVRVEGATVSDIDPRIEGYTPPPARPTIDKSSRVVTAEAWEHNVPAGCFYITGFLTREERQPAANPPRYVDQLGSAVPVNNILVEMREEDTFSDDSYGFNVTGPTGKFEFRFCDGDGFLNDELELYYRVCAEVWEGPNKIARIEHTGEQELYCYNSGVIDSEGGTVDFDVEVFKLNQQQSQVFNIAQSLYWAWRYWNNNLGAGVPFFDRTVTVNWEGGKGNGSFYSDTRSRLVIAGDASSTDEWDDSVIIHEWGHFADHQFSCNRNPGGAHTLPGNNTGVNGDKLSWGEGFPDFYQSAVRSTIPTSAAPSFYIDVSGPTVDFEPTSSPATALNEGAIAALLWDLIDTDPANPDGTPSDGSDTISYGADRILQAFTDPSFRDNGQCNMARYLTVWKNLGAPTDAVTAATVVQNVSIANPFALAAAARDNSPRGAANAAATNAAPPYDYRWWDQVTMVVDNSASMAGPAGIPKIDAVKALIREQVNDTTANPQGTEHNLYVFNANTLAALLAEGRFFLNQIDPVLNGLAANGADAGCPVQALDALARAAQNKYDGQAWVYTDGDAASGASAEFVRQQLNDRLLRGSVVLLGGCNSLPKVQSSVSNSEKSYLGLAADGSQSAGIVPYLLAALGTGGNFLYVPPDQLANAVDILRAQFNHSAGAGKWSDYVSNRFTYRWDRLEAGEYRWIPSSVMADAGQVAPNQSARVTLPQPFSFYGDATAVVDVNENGYILMNPCLSPNPQFCLFGFSQFADTLDKDLVWQYIDPGPRAAAAAPAATAATGYQVHVYHGGLDDWYFLSTEGTAMYGNLDFARRAYQVWLNLQTGEIRYLYNQVRPSDSSSARIAVSANSLFTTNEVVVSNQDLGGAVNGGGYKFTPAPPQPSKAYTVAIDSQVQSIVFLQTGYSGSFEPMVVQQPDGTAVDCNDTANVRCIQLNNGLLQFVQVNINGRTGVWTATIDAGATGEGTFSFNALAASPIQPKGLSKHALALSEHSFKLDLGRSTDDGLLTGWLQTGVGRRLGGIFALYDDGQHDDGEAGDGLFTSAGFIPPGAGVAYLWVQGTFAGESITRSDPAPYTFQPIAVQPELAEVQGFLASPTPVTFLVTNQDAVQRCYRAEISAPDGWSASPVANFCVAPNATNGPYTLVQHPLGDQRGGLVGEVSATFTELTQDNIVGGAKATVRLYRPLTSFVFDNRWGDTYLRPNGTDAVSLTINLLDDQGTVSGWTGDLGYTLATNLGTVTAPNGGRFEQGRMAVLFTAGAEAGTAQINAVVEGEPAQTTLEIRNPSAAVLELTAAPTDLRNADSSQLVAVVRDAWGAPLAGQRVRLSVGDDVGDQGRIDGSEVVTGTTASNGLVSATFTKATNGLGQVAVIAEVLAPEASSQRVLHSALVMLTLSDDASGFNKIYAPLVQNGAGSAAPPNLALYSDGMPAGWENWSWDSTVDFDSLAQAKGGTHAIAVTFNAAWAGFSLRTPAPIITSGFAAVRLWVYGSGAGNALNLHIQTTDEGGASVQVPFTAKAGEWSQVVVPLSALGNPSAIKRINIQENSGNAQPTIYVDEIELVH